MCNDNDNDNDNDKNNDLTRELKKIRKENKVRMKKSYRKNSSKLDRCHGEIMILHQVGNASLGEIQQWLWINKRMKAARSTIMRRINQWINGER